MKEKYLTIATFLIFFIISINRISGSYEYYDRANAIDTTSVPIQVLAENNEAQLMAQEVLNDPSMMKTDIFVLKY